MATIFQTFEQWRLSTVIYPAGDYLIALPGNNGYYYFKLANGTSPANRLPYAPNPAPFTQPLADGGITGPSTTTPGNLVTWTSSDGTTVGDGPAITDFATAAQGALADTAVQPGDPLADLSSSPATAGQVPEADGAGGITWVTPAGGSGITQLTGPITAGPGTGSQATTVTPNAIDNTMLAVMPSETFKGNAAATPADPADLTADDASDILDTATDPFVRTSNLPASGDVVGPASSTDGSFSKWDGTTGKLLKDGVLPSAGGNGAADDGLVAVYGPEGQLHGSAQSGFNYAVEGTATFGATAGRFVAANGTGIEVSSTGGKGGVITTAADDIGLQVENDSSTTQPALDVTNLGTADIAHFEGPTGGAQVKTDGGLNWSSVTGAQTTATALPVFGALTKGVVPAAGAVPSASNFLTETGAFAVPAGTGVPTSRTISTTTPLAGGGDLSANRTLSIADAVADGATKGAAAFTASDFDSASGVISLDYANGQKATSLKPGFLSAADWTAFNSKQASGNYLTDLTGDVTASGPGSATATIANDAVTNAKMSNMAQATVKGRAAAAGTGDPTDLTADQTSTILDAATDPFLRSASASTTYANISKAGCNIDALPTGSTWTNMPAALTWFGSATTVRPYWPRDLTYYTQARIQCLMAATPGSAGSKVRALYYTSADATIGNYLTLGSSEVEVTCDAASTLTDSGWINLVAGAKADVWIALAGISGNGTADPVFQHIWIMFR